MVKKALGVSLDEIGIGLINVGSVSFEYVASLFDDKRLQRHCAIITDSDAIMPDAKKCHIEAAKRGETRTEKLNSLYGDNRWVDMFYAPYTFEVDFANESRNHRFIETVIKAHYTQETAIDGHVRELSGTDDAKRYDTVLTVAKELGKGWYATLLSTVIDETVIIPSYMLQALAFVSQSIIDEKLLKKMALHTLEGYYGDSAVVLKEFLTNAKTPDEISTAIQAFCDTYPDNNFAYFISFRKDVVHG